MTTDRAVHSGARREAMRAQLIAAMTRRNRRRRNRARLVTALAAVALAAVTWQVALGPHRGARSGPGMYAEQPPSRLVRRVRGGPSGRIRQIDDDELVRRLSEIDRPSGLIRSGEKAWLTERVADD